MIRSCRQVDVDIRSYVIITALVRSVGDDAYIVP